MNVSLFLYAEYKELLRTTSSAVNTIFIVIYFCTQFVNTIGTFGF